MCDRANTWVFCRDLHLTLRLSRLLQKDLFKGKWSLGKSCFKQNYCSAYHTRFAVFFPLPSCCVSLVSFLNFSQPGCLGYVGYKFYSSWLRLCFLGRIKKRSCDLTSHILWILHHQKKPGRSEKGSLTTTTACPRAPRNDKKEKQHKLRINMRNVYIWIWNTWSEFTLGFKTKADDFFKYLENNRRKQDIRTKTGQVRV